VQWETLFDHVLDYPPAPLPDEVTPENPDPRDEAEKQLPGLGGIYLLTDANDHVIQLGSAGHLRHALQIRLRPPSSGDNQASVVSRRRADLSQIVRRIWWRRAHCSFEIMYEYWRIARLLMPQTYLKQIAFGPCWFVHVDPAGQIPRFAVGKTLRAGSGANLGPMVTHKDATGFVQIVQDAFDLCRCDQILEQTPHGQPCAYFDMGKCSAPCNGSIPMSAYREQIADALSFACGQREPYYLHWQQQMREAAEKMAFEQAATVKQRIERARAIEHRAYELTRPIGDFNYLIVQRGKGRTWIKPFFVRSGQIRPAEPVKLKEIENAVPNWLYEMTGAPKSQETLADSSDLQAVSEQVWLVSHFLFKKDTPGLFIPASQLPEPSMLAERIRDTFAVKPQEHVPEGSEHAVPDDPSSGDKNEV